MSLRDLQRAGLVRPKEEWGQADLHSSISRVSLISAWVVAAVSAVLMYVGNGGHVTWIGVCGMLVFIGWFTYLSMHAIDVRAQTESRQEQPEAPMPAAGDSTESPSGH